MKILCCIPSRGVIHSRTLEARDANFARLRSAYCRELETETLYEHEKPIPAAQEEIVERALAKEPDYVWMLEEDMVPEDGWLIEAMHLRLPRTPHPSVDVLLAPYKNIGGTWAFEMHPLHSQEGRIAYGGIGCLLISGDNLAMMKCPRFWFDCNWGWDSSGNPVRQNLRETDAYGGCEVAFYVRLHEAGIAAYLTTATAKHAILDEWGKPRTNQGCHKIRLV